MVKIVCTRRFAAICVRIFRSGLYDSQMNGLPRATAGKSVYLTARANTLEESEHLDIALSFVSVVDDTNM